MFEVDPVSWTPNCLSFGVHDVEEAPPLCAGIPPADDPDQAEQHAEEMLHLGEARNDAMWACFGSLFSGSTRHFSGKLVDARAYLENALSLWDPTFRRFSALPDDPYVQILIFLSRTLLYLGYVDQARLRRDEALAEARRLSPYNLVFALCFAWYGELLAAVAGLTYLIGQIAPLIAVLSIGFPETAGSRSDAATSSAASMRWMRC